MWCETRDTPFLPRKRGTANSGEVLFFSRKTMVHGISEIF